MKRWKRSSADLIITQELYRGLTEGCKLRLEGLVMRWNSVSQKKKNKFQKFHNLFRLLSLNETSQFAPQLHDCVSVNKLSAYTKAK